MEFPGVEIEAQERGDAVCPGIADVAVDVAHHGVCTFRAVQRPLVHIAAVRVLGFHGQVGKVGQFHDPQIPRLRPVIGAGMVGGEPFAEKKHGIGGIRHVAQRVQRVDHGRRTEQARAPERYGAHPRDLFHQLRAAVQAVGHFLGQDGHDARDIVQRFADGFVKQGMRADLVAPLFDLLDDARMFLQAVAGEKEGARNVVACQYVKNDRRAVLKPFVIGRPTADIRFHIKTKNHLQVCHAKTP